MNMLEQVQQVVDQDQDLIFIVEKKKNNDQNEILRELTLY